MAARVPSKLAKLDQLRIASAQYRVKPISSWQEFVDQVEPLVRTAADYGCKLLVLPEYFSVQLLSLGGAQVAAASAERNPSPGSIKKLIHDLSKYVPQFTQLFSALATRYKIHIVAGSIPVAKKDGKGVLNESFLFAPNGRFDSQAKLHMTRFENEDWKVSPGSKLKIFDTAIGKLVIAICYDVEFPELIRAAANAGAQIVCVPSCTDNRAGWLRVRACSQARAIENQVYVVHSALVGGLPRFSAVHQNYGTSAILTPSDYPFARDGVLAEGTPNDETLVIGDVSLKTLAAHRKNGTVLTLRDSARSAALARTARSLRL